MKKKGLIISTVVMVVVLIASLTTATYAWFSAQASATVDDLSITTTASSGLQIAMTNTKDAVNNIVSGEMTYENGQWGGDSNTWGSYLGFGGINIGNMENAVTKVKTGTKVSEIETKYVSPATGYQTASTNANAVITNFNKDTEYYIAKKWIVVASGTTIEEGQKDTHTYFKYGTHYTLSTTASNPNLTLATTASAGNTVYSIEISKTPITESSTPGADNYYCTITRGQWLNILKDANYITTGSSNTETITKDLYLVPTGYDNNTNPTGYRIATENAHFYKLSMAVTSTKETKAIGFSIAIKPTGANAGEAKYPGMAAASRIEIATARLAEETTTYQSKEFKDDTALQPFEKYKLQSNLTFAKGSESNKNEDGKYAYYLGKGAMQQGVVFFVTMYIWVEGTDKECVNATAGTGFGVGINFIYNADSENLNFKTNELLGDDWTGTVSSDLMPSTAGA